MIKDAPIDPATGQRVNPFASYGTPQKETSYIRISMVTESSMTMINMR